MISNVFIEKDDHIILGKPQKLEHLQPPTMMALLAADDCSWHHYWVPDLASIPEDDEVWVFQDPPLHLWKILLLPQHGTHHTIAADIENFPFWHLAIK